MTAQPDNAALIARIQSAIDQMGPIDMHAGDEVADDALDALDSLAAALTAAEKRGERLAAKVSERAREAALLLMRASLLETRATTAEERAQAAEDEIERAHAGMVHWLVAANAAETQVRELREELQSQWEANHYEHCQNDWPHPGMCHWPLPDVLAQGDRVSAARSAERDSE